MAGADARRADDPAEQGKGRRWAPLAAGLAVVVLATVLVRLPTLRFPLDQDGAVFVYCARTWSEGGLPYRDAWDHKSPLIFLTYRALFAVMPPSVVPVNTALRIGSAVCDAATAVLLLFLARRLLSLGAGVVAGLVYGLFTGSPMLQMEAFQPERLTVLFATAGVLAAAAYADTWKYRHAALSGLLFGLALIAKQIVAPVGVVVWAWVTWAAWRAEGRGALKRVALHSALLAAGAALPFGVCVIYFAARGAFAEFWECTYTFNVIYAREHRKGSLLEGVRRLFQGMVFDHSFLWVAGAGGLVAALARRRSRRAGWLIALWAGAAFLALILPGQFAKYYYVPTVAPLAIASAVVVLGLWAAARRGGIELVAGGVGALLLLGMLAVAAKRGYGQYQVATDPTEPNAVIAKVAEHLAAVTEPDDRLYMWGGRPQVYVLSGRKNATRYLYNFHYHLPRERAFHYQRSKLEEILAGLRAHEPPYIVATDSFERFPELEAYVTQHYEFEDEWPAARYSPRVYRRKGEQG